jgi:hypothetical protein
LRRGLDPTPPRVVTFSEVPFVCGPWQVATCLLPMAEVGRRGMAMLSRRMNGEASCPAVAVQATLQEPPWPWP